MEGDYPLDALDTKEGLTAFALSVVLGAAGGGLTSHVLDVGEFEMLSLDIALEMAGVLASAIWDTLGTTYDVVTGHADRIEGTAEDE